MSVIGLLKDRSVRWQVITIVVINIGMQLSGIDAVSPARVFLFPTIALPPGSSAYLGALSPSHTSIPVLALGSMALWLTVVIALTCFGGLASLGPVPPSTALKELIEELVKDRKSTRLNSSH